jgi:hypothetical protein
LHDDEFVVPAPGILDGAFDPIVILPPLAPTGANCAARLLAKFVGAPVVVDPPVVPEPGACFADFAAVPGVDGASTPENAYQKHTTQAMMRTTKVNIRFTPIALLR